MKKTVKVEKKMTDKQTKDLEKIKNKTKAQIPNMINLATANKRLEEIETFKDILFNYINSNKNLIDNIMLTSILYLILFLENLNYANSIH